jgi:hypothetical protein
MQRRSFIVGFAAAGVWPAISFAQGDPLLSWNEGPRKQAILDFVRRVTSEGGRDFRSVAGFRLSW